MGCGGLSGIAGETFPLDCFGLGFETGLWIEMVMTLCLSVVGARVLEMNRGTCVVIKTENAGHND